MNAQNKEFTPAGQHASQRFAQFTLTTATNDWVYINPAYVVSVFPSEKYTEIRVAASRIGFRPMTYRVREMAKEVLERLSA